MDLTEFIEAIKLTNAVMVEVGSYRGESTESFAKSGKFRRIYAIDPWENMYSNTDPAAWVHDMGLVEADFNARMAQYPQVKKLKMTSELAVQFFEDGQLDMVYIDANHEYESVKKDIGLWLPKVKEGGLLTGHDYDNAYALGTCDGVKQAVDERFGKPSGVYFDSSWMVIV